MANPVKQLQRKSEEYQRLDKADRRRFWSDGILNNALYILMVIFIVYTAIKNKNFLSAGSIANIVSLVAASLAHGTGHRGLYRPDRYRPVRRTCGRPDRSRRGRAAAGSHHLPEAFSPTSRPLPRVGFC